VSGQSFGYAWYTFDQRIGYPTTQLDVDAVSGAALDDFNVLIVPSVSAGAMNGALGESGRERIARWVRAGGVLITLDAATEWLASESLDLARLRVLRDTVREGGDGFQVSVVRTRRVRDRRRRHTVADHGRHPAARSARAAVLVARAGDAPDDVDPARRS
jgi:hypothetical protein